MTPNKSQDENDTAAKTLQDNDVTTKEMRQDLLKVLEGGERVNSIRLTSYNAERGQFNDQ